MSDFNLIKNNKTQILNSTIMKKIILSVALVAASFTTVAQVGIGTTAPVNALEVHRVSDGLNAAVRIVNTSANSNIGHKFLYLGVAGPTATATPSWLNAGVLEAATSGGLILSAYDTDAQIKFEVASRSLTAMLIGSNGRVGIGVPAGANPTSQLQVVGLETHADNATAIAAGLTTGAFYHNGDGVVRVVF